MRKKYYCIKYISGETKIMQDIWDNVRPYVNGVPGVTYKGFDRLEDAKCWLGKPTIPYRDKDTPFKENVMYIFVDGSYSSKRGVSGWGWVAVINDNIVAENYGVITDLPEGENSRNICGELEATIQAVKWYLDYPEKVLKPVIVHDYSGIGNWALGYWEAKKPVSMNYQIFIYPHKDLFNFEKCRGHSDIKWNDYADELTRRGYED